MAASTRSNRPYIGVNGTGVGGRKGEGPRDAGREVGRVEYREGVIKEDGAQRGGMWGQGKISWDSKLKLTNTGAATR